MPKKNITYRIATLVDGKEIINDIATVPAIIEDNCIKYIVEGTKTIYNLETNTLIRENRSLKIVLQFIDDEETEVFIKVKDINKKVSMKVKTKELYKDKNIIKIEYELERMTFKYSIEVEE